MKKTAFFVYDEELITSDFREACELLRLRGYDLCIICQGARLNEKQYWELSKLFKTELGVDTFLICQHDENTSCICKPPQPYLIDLYLKSRKVDPEDCLFFAPSFSYVCMGHAAKISRVSFVPPDWSTGVLGAVKKRLATTPAPPTV